MLHALIIAGLVQWNQDITVSLGTVLTGCYTLGDLHAYAVIL